MQVSVTQESSGDGKDLDCWRKEKPFELLPPPMRQKLLLYPVGLPPGPKQELAGRQTGLVFFGNQVFFDYVPSSASSLPSSGTNQRLSRVQDLGISFLPELYDCDTPRYLTVTRLLDSSRSLLTDQSPCNSLREPMISNPTLHLAGHS